MSETNTKAVERPKFVKDEHLEFLDNLRESGITNMFGSSPYLREVYPRLTIEESTKVVAYWMKTFGERHKKT